MGPVCVDRGIGHAGGYVSRMMSLLSCVKYSRPWVCMSKAISTMFLVQYHHYQSGVGIIIRAMSALSSEGCHHYRIILLQSECGKVTVPCG